MLMILMVIRLTQSYMEPRAKAVWAQKWESNPIGGRRISHDRARQARDSS